MLASLTHSKGNSSVVWKGEREEATGHCEVVLSVLNNIFHSVHSCDRYGSAYWLAYDMAVSLGL